MLCYVGGVVLCFVVVCFVLCISLCDDVVLFGWINTGMKSLLW